MANLSALVPPSSELEIHRSPFGFSIFLSSFSNDRFDIDVFSHIGWLSRRGTKPHSSQPIGPVPNRSRNGGRYSVPISCVEVQLEATRIADVYADGKVYPWQVLPLIHGFIMLYHVLICLIFILVSSPPTKIDDGLVVSSHSLFQWFIQLIPTRMADDPPISWSSCRLDFGSPQGRADLDTMRSVREAMRKCQASGSRTELREQLPEMDFEYVSWSQK